MKEITVYLSVLILSTKLGLAELAAPLPEFQVAARSHGQERTQKDINGSADVFYTGKPFSSDQGAYLFKFRNYAPELLRWTTTDPSGFPECANNQIPCRMLNALDPDGQLSVTGITTPNLGSLDVTWENHKYTITAPEATAFQGSVANDININITGYSVFKEGDAKGGAFLTANVTGTPDIASGQAYGWTQYLTITGEDPHFDVGTNSTSYLYPGPSGPGYFSDNPVRAFSQVSPGHPMEWQAVLTYVSYNTTTMAVTGIYGGLTWGFTITE